MARGGVYNLREPKIGLALGSGGARGFAHVGVLKALKDANINLDYIAGSSMGALVGSLYCVGHTLEDMYKMATLFRRKFYMDYTIPKMGLISGKKLYQLIYLLSHGKKLEELTPKLFVITTDLLSGEKVILDSGLIAEAVRASISIPGIFVPVKMQGRLLVDGGVIDRVPVSVVKDAGADITIAVDISHFNTEPTISSIFDVILQSIDIMQREMVKQVEISTDVLLRPMVEKFSATAYTNVEEIINIGEEEAKKKLPLIHEAIEKWRGSHN
jgi:NTE family protein